ncbi:MAG: hypothetical protein Q8Q74_10995, partial [Polaromonas sp.]|nr:hypothetical protein [Polaromonas sp.]
WAPEGDWGIRRVAYAGEDQSEHLFAAKRDSGRLKPIAAHQLGPSAGAVATTLERVFRLFDFPVTSLL